MGRYQLPYPQENSSQLKNELSPEKSPLGTELVPDAQLIELHVYKEELLLDVPIPALRFQIKFRTPEERKDNIRVELIFKSVLKQELGDSRDATTLELAEEHFGWTVYTYGYTIGGDTFSSDLLDAVVQNPYDYVSAYIVQ